MHLELLLLHAYYHMIDVQKINLCLVESPIKFLKKTHKKKSRVVLEFESSRLIHIWQRLDLNYQFLTASIIYKTACVVIYHGNHLEQTENEVKFSSFRAEKLSEASRCMPPPPF